MRVGGQSFLMDCAWCFGVVQSISVKCSVTSALRSRLPSFRFDCVCDSFSDFIWYQAPACPPHRPSRYLPSRWTSWPPSSRGSGTVRLCVMGLRRRWRERRTIWVGCGRVGVFKTEQRSIGYPDLALVCAHAVLFVCLVFMCTVLSSASM